MSLSRLRARRPRVVGGVDEDAADGGGRAVAGTSTNPSVEVAATTGHGDDEEDEEEEDEALPTIASILAGRSKGKGRAGQQGLRRCRGTRDEDEDEIGEDEVDDEDLDDSADEWQPEKDNTASMSSRLKRRRGGDQDDDGDEFSDEEEEEAHAIAAKKPKPAKAKGKRTATDVTASSSRSATSATPRQGNAGTSKPGLSASSKGRSSKASTSATTASASTSSTSNEPRSLGRAAGLAALAKGSNLSAKEIIERLHRARALAENDFKRERGEVVVDDDPSGSPSGPGPKRGSAAASPSKAEPRSVSLTAGTDSRASTSAQPAQSSAIASSMGARPAPSNPASTRVAQIQLQPPPPPPPMSVASWLGVVPPDNELPWPTITPEKSIIQDRESLFIAYVFPLDPNPNNTATTLPRLISAHTSHLIRSVQPATTPRHLLPSHLRSAPAHKRGAMHDMYAARTRVLKVGRDGSRGWIDWGTWEDADDDGEKWGSQKIQKVIRDEGVEDVLVFVSRWYGGTLLGPARFQHIIDVTRVTLRLHVSKQKVAKLRLQLEELDVRVATLRSQLASSGPPPTSSTGPATSGSALAPTSSSVAAAYTDLTEAKAQRLLVARRKMVELLEKKLEKEKGPGAGLVKIPDAGDAAADASALVDEIEAAVP